MTNRRAKEVECRNIDLSLSPLERERVIRNWSRDYVEQLTRIPASTLYNWEKGLCAPGANNIAPLCKLYGKTLEQLGFVNNCGILTAVSLELEGIPMADLIRRTLFYDLGSRINSMVDAWPRRNYHYEELQGAIDKTITDYNGVVQTNSTYEINRREALKSVSLMPVQLCGGLAIATTGKINREVDTGTFLAHCAAGIAACWYLRRGKELDFVLDLLPTYEFLLQPILFSQSLVHRKAAATQLTQCFMLKSSLTNDLQNSSQAIVYGEQAIQNSLIAEDPITQALAQRMLCNSFYGQEKYTEAVLSAERARSLINGNMDRGIQSFILAGLASSQATEGKSDEALSSLKQALKVFDPTKPFPIYAQFSYAILMINSGVVHRELEHWGAAATDFEKSINSHDVSALGKIQASLERVKVEACRNDQPRDKDLAKNLWEEAMKSARELKSQRYINLARKAYPLLIAAWPSEEDIKELRERF